MPRTTNSAEGRCDRVFVGHARLSSEPRVGRGVEVQMHRPQRAKLDDCPSDDRRRAGKSQLAGINLLQEKGFDRVDLGSAANAEPDSGQVGQLGRATIDQFECDAVARESVVEVDDDRTYIGIGCFGGQRFSQGASQRHARDFVRKPFGYEGCDFAVDGRRHGEVGRSRHVLDCVCVTHCGSEQRPPCSVHSRTGCPSLIRGHRRRLASGHADIRA